MSESVDTVPHISDLKPRVEAAGQGHVLRFMDDLDHADRIHLLAQINDLDLERLPVLIDEYVRSKPAFNAEQHTIKPPAAVAFDDPDWDRNHYRDIGNQLIKDGKVAAFVAAGGQGSRLGYDGPKGCFPGAAVTRRPLFACLADWILRERERHNVSIPWYVMCSPLNVRPTRQFFADHDHFGLPKDDVFFLVQGTMPALDSSNGRILLASKSEIATAPDGHGGTFRALHASGALDDMKRRGIEHLSYVQIDNPLARVIDPVFLGLHAAHPTSSAEMSTKSIAKTDPNEKVGLLCDIDDATGVVEYSDLPEHLASQRDDNGKLALRHGNTAIHLIARSFIERLTEGGSLSLPFHRAEKKVACIDPETADPVNPTTNNAVKLEMFIFDALPLADRSLIYEVARTDEFAPIKNAEGKDSPATSARLQTERVAAWLEARGVGVPRTPTGEADCTLEVSPRTAAHPDEFDARDLPSQIGAGERICL